MSQQLVLPMAQCTVNAGYKTAAYLKKWGFPHYGIDLGNPEKQRTVYSPGKGTVVAAGMDGSTPSERMGNAMVLVFPEVVLPDGRQMSLACRLFHLDSLAVKAGQTVERGDVLGVYGNTGANTSGPHLHLEFDTDTRYPQHAVGIRSGGAIIKKGTRDTTVDPSLVWFRQEGQSLRDGWGGKGIAAGWISPRDLAVPALPADSPSADWKALYEEERASAEKLRQTVSELAGRLMDAVK